MLRILSVVAATVPYDNFGGHRRFLPMATAEGGLIVVRDSSDLQARPERFTFRPRGPRRPWFAWEVQRNGGWVLGDSLACDARGPEASRRWLARAPATR